LPENLALLCEIQILMLSKRNARQLLRSLRNLKLLLARQKIISAGLKLLSLKFSERLTVYDVRACRYVQRGQNGGKCCRPRAGRGRPPGEE
jgi:hypothetical protein